MHSVLQKFTKLGGMFFHPCVGTGAIAQASILKSRHKKVVGCDMDSDSFELIKLELIKEFVDQVLNSKSDIEEGKPFSTAACEPLAMQGFSISLQRTQAWAADQNLGPVKVVPV